MLHKLHLSGRLAAWAQAHIMQAATDPRGFLDVVNAWAERFAFLMLPIAALLLGRLFITLLRMTVLGAGCLLGILALLGLQR